MTARLITDVRLELERRYPQIWDPDDLHRDFQVLGWSIGHVHVRERETEFEGTLEFLHIPRFYYNLQKGDRNVQGEK